MERNPGSPASPRARRSFSPGSRNAWIPSDVGILICKFHWYGICTYKKKLCWLNVCLISLSVCCLQCGVPFKMAAGFTPSSSDKGKGRSKLPNKRVLHGFHLVKGKSRHDMEDYHVAECRQLNDHDLGLFAIFDGHLGHKVPCYLQSNLFDNILNEPGFWTETEKAIKSAYHQTDRNILAQTADLGPGGSTAVTAIIIDGKKLFVANVGDSRAVLCQDGIAVQLTVDHEPSIERQNIEKTGGFVTNLPGDVPRVNGQLAVARVFGDGSLKQHLSSEPDVVRRIIETTTEFLILASDGLWKVMKNQEAVDLVRKIKDPQVAAKCLTEAAVSRKSKDDISCIVVRFQQ